MLNRRAESSAAKLYTPITRNRNQPWKAYTRNAPLSPSLLCEPLTLIEVHPVTDSYESSTHYEIIVPISGIDHRNVYVFAGPRSIVIEILTKKAIQHASGDAILSERTDQRIRREFILRVPIEAGSTKVKFEGDFLQITASKSREEEQETWSEFIRFDV
ncbi:MAG TPA: Hsp20/alpha crystallin family protein [Bryobacteraceae bacterium]|jgi:HSP20 family molecular chaperone IbpA|nr:Hsp20/alpha crystallin family protein [Bryobacteraceae bacterium]